MPGEKKFIEVKKHIKNIKKTIADFPLLKQQKLQDLLNSQEDYVKARYGKLPASPPTGSQKRAVDNPEYGEIHTTPPKMAWGTSVSRFRIPILIRIHFRKLEFKPILHLVQARKIWAESDLRFIYETLSLMMSRAEEDVQLKQHMPIMQRLRNTVHARLIRII